MVNIEIYETGTLIKQTVKGSDYAIWLSIEETRTLYEHLRQRLSGNLSEAHSPVRSRRRKSIPSSETEPIHDILNDEKVV